MPTNDVDRRALTLPGVDEKSHQGKRDFRTRHGIFATLPSDGVIRLRLAPQEQAELVAERPDIFSAQDNAWGRQGWTAIQLAAIDADELRELLALAWLRVAPKKLATVTAIRTYPLSGEPGAEHDTIEAITKGLVGDRAKKAPVSIIGDDDEDSARSNLVVDISSDALVAMVGLTLQIGTCILGLTMPAGRCPGVYADVLTPGTIGVGDGVSLGPR